MKVFPHRKDTVAFFSIVELEGSCHLTGIQMYICVWIYENGVKEIVLKRFFSRQELFPK